MGRIEQAFSLAERYVGAFERFVEMSAERDRAYVDCANRQVAQAEDRMSFDREIVGPDIRAVAESVAALVQQLGALDMTTMINSVRALPPNGEAVSDE